MGFHKLCRSPLETHQKQALNSICSAAFLDQYRDRRLILQHSGNRSRCLAQRPLGDESAASFSTGPLRSTQPSLIPVSRAHTRSSVLSCSRVSLMTPSRRHAYTAFARPRLTQSVVTKIEREHPCCPGFRRSAVPHRYASSGGGPKRLSVCQDGTHLGIKRAIDKPNPYSVLPLPPPHGARAPAASRQITASRRLANTLDRLYILTWW